MRDKNKISKFIYTYFSYSRNYCTTNDCQNFISLWNKQWIKEFFRSYKALWTYDPNLNGFWNIYSFLLIISFIYILHFILFIYLFKKDKINDDEKIYWIIILYIIIWTFLLPFPWARYFPLLYLLPIVLTLFWRQKTIIKIILTLYLTNALLIWGIILARYVGNGLEKNKQINFINKIYFDNVYYNKFLEESYSDKKFFWFYENKFKNINKEQKTKYELMKLCWLKNNLLSESIVICPNWWYMLVWDYWSLIIHIQDYFYLK